MNKREFLGSYLCSMRNLDCYSSDEAIAHFSELTEKVISELGFSEEELHNAYMNQTKKKSDER